jgi:type II secretory pathway pseudopilin PulG
VCMFAKNKWQGSTLIELMVAILVMGLISPTLFQWIGSMVTHGNQVVRDRQLSIERIDLNQRIYEDIINSHALTNDCCFSNLDFLICYDIKNGRVRRRKRKWASQRFYTHYIGQHPRYNRVHCANNNGLITMEWINNATESENWVFLMGNQ